MMRMRGIGSRLTVVALAGGVIATAQLPAFASPGAGPTVSISAKSTLPVVTGDVFVVYKAPAKFSAVTIHGQIHGATSGEVAQLFASQFPSTSGFKKAGAPVTLNVTGTNSYTFHATPSVATRYKVELLAASSSTSPLANSPVTTVYVASDAQILSQSKCGRPVCHLTVKLRILVPPKDLKAEIKKPIFPYFAFNHSRRVPTVLALRASHGKVSTPRKVASNAFSATATFSFSIGDGPFQYLFTICSKDTEASDGLGLPGHHGCGMKKISSKTVYLG
jgi:hypothetical protein